MKVYAKYDVKISIDLDENESHRLVKQLDRAVATSSGDTNLLNSLVYEIRQQLNPSKLKGGCL